MREHALPQDVTGYRFHIIGNMTLKQFAEVGAGCVAGFILYETNLPDLLKWPLILLAVGTGALAAFVPFEERPLDQWILVLFQALYRPTQFYWKRMPKIPEPFLYKPRTELHTLAKEVDLTPAKRQRVKEYMHSIVVEEQTDLFDQYQDQRLVEIMGVFQNPNDEQIVETYATLSLPQTSASQTLNGDLDASVGQEAQTAVTPDISAAQTATPAEKLSVPAESGELSAPVDMEVLETANTQLPNIQTPPAQPAKVVQTENPQFYPSQKPAVQSITAQLVGKPTAVVVSEATPPLQAASAGVQSVALSSTLSSSPTVQVQAAPPAPTTSAANTEQPVVLSEAGTPTGGIITSPTTSQPSKSPAKPKLKPIKVDELLSPIQTKTNVEIKRNAPAQNSNLDAITTSNIISSLGSGSVVVNTPEINISQPSTEEVEESLSTESSRSVVVPESRGIVIKKTVQPNEQYLPPSALTSGPGVYVDQATITTRTIQPTTQTVVQNAQLPFPNKPKEPNKLVGMALDKNNSPLANTIIEILTPDGLPARAVKTNILGQFFITTPLTNGQYTVMAEKDGYNFSPQQLVVSGEILEPIEVRSL